MKRRVGTIFLFLMIAVFLTGTTGISFYIHECSSNHTKEVFAFPELLNNTVSCCCNGEVQGSIPNELQELSFNEPECCKNSHVYLKASFTGFPSFYQFCPELLRKDLLKDQPGFQHEERSIQITSFTPTVDHPPPRSGRILVHFLQQIKIPVPVS